MSKIEFETFKEIPGYWENQLKLDNPSNGNFLQYRKYKITIELVEESEDVLIKRLEDLRKEASGYDRKERINKEIDKIKNSL